MSSSLAAGVLSGARCHIMASIAHVERGKAYRGVYTLTVHCRRARRTRDTCSTPRIMPATRSSTTPLGFTLRASADLPWRPQMSRTPSVCAVGNSVDALLEVHPAACGLVLDLALRHSIAQCGACGSMPCCR